MLSYKNLLIKKFLLNQIIFRYLSKYTIIEMNIVFKALNDATRREILEMLQKKDLTAGEIADKNRDLVPD